MIILAKRRVSLQCRTERVRIRSRSGFIYIYMDRCTKHNNGADVTYLDSNWLIGWLRNKTMARAPRRVSPSSLLLSASVSNSRLQI